MPGEPQLRVARPSADPDRVAAMYQEGLGFEDLGSFRDHDGFDGIMLGTPGGRYHLELTREHGASAPPVPHPDALLVFYLPDPEEWEAACARMSGAGFVTVPSHNPYWDARGRTFGDPDGYRVVLQNAEWREHLGGPM
jgi:catechol 2,3-dioxygenase-like lactoylglutathione lyase family enzyme